MPISTPADDPSAPELRSAAQDHPRLLNGSRGPMLRRATPLDWAGDPFEAGAAFTWSMASGPMQQTLAHYADYADVVGDNPLNLQSTTLGLNAYALGAGDRYRRLGARLSRRLGRARQGQ